jgi:membrane protein
MKKVTFKGLWQVLKKSFAGFGDYKIPKISASLAYYTVFSMGPLMIVIIYLASFFYGRESIEGEIYGQLNGFIGSDAAAQVQEIIKNATITGSGIAAIIGVVTLLIGATGVFAEIQDSINTIWGLKPKPKLGLAKLIQSRLLSFGLIGSLGFLLLVSLAATAVVEGIGARLKAMFPDVGVVLFYIVNLLLTLGVVTVLFAVIFKVLPDAKIKFKDVWPGAIATSLLFLLGKFAISFYISQSNIGSTYGTAGSLVVLLVWIYYSSIILYFGAVFTKEYAVQYGAEIRPNHYAVVVKDVQVEQGQQSIQEKEKGGAGAPARPQMRQQNAPAPALTVDNRRKYLPRKPRLYETKPNSLLTIAGNLIGAFWSSAEKKKGSDDMRSGR